jgi:hypothetical protein
MDRLDADMISSYNFLYIWMSESDSKFKVLKFAIWLKFVSQTHHGFNIYIYIYILYIYIYIYMFFIFNIVHCNGKKILIILYIYIYMFFIFNIVHWNGKKILIIFFSK